MIAELAIGELVEVFCSPCSGLSPGVGDSLAGGGGSAAATQDAPAADPDIPDCTDGAPSGPSASDIATDMAVGLGSDAALEASAQAAGASGAAGGLLSVLAAAVSGSQSFAEGATAIFRNKGNGFGGTSCGGKSSMDEAMGHINKTRGQVQP